jgi:hypothetical protein
MAPDARASFGANGLPSIDPEVVGVGWNAAGAAAAGASAEGAGDVAA